MPRHKMIVLASRPEGAPSVDNFAMVERDLPELKDGELLVRHLFLSLDPYMRGRMNEGKSYAAPQALGEAMIGGTVGEVEASRNPRFAVGDKVLGMGGWRTHAICDGRDLRKVDPAVAPLSAWLGPVGMPGVTAWYGINHIIAPKPGETVLVSAATGAVGTVAGQLTKLMGAKAVGIAGGPDKCAFAVETLGYDACVDHRAPDFADRLRRALPAGVDGLFENVGGEPLNLAMRRLNPFARIALCGLVASRYDGSRSPVRDISPILTMRATMRGFIVSEHMELWPQAMAELAGHVAAGRIKYRETIAQGLESAPAAFLGMLRGENFGKQLVRLD